MMTPEQMKEIFQIADAALKLNEMAERLSNKEAISRQALGLAYVTACYTAGVDEAEMCTTIMQMRRQAERRMDREEIKQ